MKYLILVLLLGLVLVSGCKLIGDCPNCNCVCPEYNQEETAKSIKAEITLRYDGSKMYLISDEGIVINNNEIFEISSYDYTTIELHLIYPINKNKYEGRLCINGSSSSFVNLDIIKAEEILKPDNLVGYSWYCWKINNEIYEDIEIILQAPAKPENSIMEILLLDKFE